MVRRHCSFSWFYCFPEIKGAIHTGTLINNYPQTLSHASACGASTKGCSLLSFVQELMTGEKDLGFGIRLDFLQGYVCPLRRCLFAVLHGNHFLADAFPPYCVPDLACPISSALQTLSLVCRREELWEKAHLLFSGCLTQAANFHLVSPHQNGKPGPVLIPQSQPPNPRCFYWHVS